MRKPALILSILCLSFFSIVSGACAAQGSSAVDTIAGRRVESQMLRNPTSQHVVVFEAGSRNTLDKWGTVPETISRDATMFVYNRPGYGSSEAAGTPRDGRTIVDELRAVLRHKGLRPPYVLVGHSLGGLYMQLFARAYPQEVEGLVLVDSLYPRMVKKTEDFPWTTRIAGRLGFSKTVWQEIENIDATGELVLALGAIDDKPIVRLLNQPKSATAIPVDFGAFRTDPETRALVRALYPNAVTVVADSSHQMPMTSPQVVTAAIQRVISNTRKAPGMDEKVLAQPARHIGDTNGAPKLAP